MKKLIVNAIVLGVLGSVLSLQASEPKCSSITDILKTLKEDGITDVYSMNLQGGKWVIRHGNENNEVKEIYVKCTPDSGSGHLIQSKSEQVPAKMMRIDEITKKALAEESGVITHIEFKDRQWHVTVESDTLEITLTYEFDGALAGKTITE